MSILENREDLCYTKKQPYRVSLQEGNKMENPKYISSLSEYLQAIEALKFHYPNAPLVQNPTSNPFLFRGLSNVSYSLLPGILRGHK